MLIFEGILASIDPRRAPRRPLLVVTRSAKKEADEGMLSQLIRQHKCRRSSQD